MTQQDRKKILADISNLKKDLVLMKVKASSGETISTKDLRNKKKEVARLFTQLNANKA